MRTKKCSLCGVLAATAVSGLFILSGCGDETTNVTETTGLSTVENGAAMPGCSKENEGEMVFVSDSSGVYYCADEKWQTLKGEDGADGKDGANGKDGAAGAKGEPGTSGANGENGKDGSSTKDTVVINNLDTVVVSKIDTVVVIDTVLGLNGSDGASCTAEILDDSRGYRIVCGGDSVGVVLNGTDGADGKDAKRGIPSVLYDCDSGEYSCVTTAYLNPEIEYGELLDERDGKVYRTVQVGNQLWMAQNLDYNDATDASLQGQTYCYYDSLAFCETYGRLYTWSAAMGFGSTYNTTLTSEGMVKEVHRGVCPTGWHMPTAAEWQTLADYVDAHNGAEGVGTSLKARYLWRQDTTLKYQNITMGSDLFGWAGLPGDNYVASEKVTINGKTYIGFDGSAGLNGYWWSSTESAASTATARNLGYNHEALGVSQYSKSNAYSVRCLRDSD